MPRGGTGPLSADGVSFQLCTPGVISILRRHQHEKIQQAPPRRYGGLAGRKIIIALFLYHEFVPMLCVFPKSIWLLSMQSYFSSFVGYEELCSLLYRP